MGQSIFNKHYGDTQDKILDRDEGFVENIGYELFACDDLVRFDGLLLLYFALQVACGMVMFD